MPLKRIGYVLLTFLLLLQAGGLLVCYEVEQGMVRYRNECRAAKMAGRRHLLVLTERDYASARVGKRDLRIEGEMYDMVSMVRKDGRVYVTAVRDHKEERIMKRIAAIAGHTQQGAGAVPDGLLRLLSVVYVLPARIELSPFLGEDSKVFHEHVRMLNGRGVDVGLRPPSMLVLV
jgi:hypothetical protein